MTVFISHQVVLSSNREQSIYLSTPAIEIGLDWVESIRVETFHLAATASVVSRRVERRVGGAIPPDSASVLVRPGG